MQKSHAWSALVVLAATAIAIAVGSQTETPHEPNAVTEAEAAAAPSDLNGSWQLDAKRSDAPMERGGERGRGGRGGGQGRGGMGGGMGGGMNGGRMGSEAGGERPGGARMPRLPEFLHVTQTSKVVSFEDSSGKVLLEVATIPAAADTFARAPGVPHLSGTWNGTQLLVNRESPRGGTMAETWSLTDAGATLVVTTSFAGREGMGPRNMKRVYARVIVP